MNWRIQIQRVSRETYTLSMNWRLQNPKGFRENIYTNMTSIKISSSVHSETTSVTSPLSWKSGPMGERTPREGIRVWELIIRESADFTLLIIGNSGALVSFFNYIPVLLFPKKIM